MKRTEGDSVERNSCACNSDNGGNGDTDALRDPYPYPQRVCNGTVCGFAGEMREEIAHISSSLAQLATRITSVELAVERVSIAATTAFRDISDIKRVLRVLYNITSVEKENGNGSK